MAIKIERLHEVVDELTVKFSNTFKSMLPEEPNEDETNETDLDITFSNPSLEMQCDMCDFVAKNIRGLKIHKTSKHTKAMKFKCEVCSFETNSKKLNNDHKSSKCSIITLCDFCSESFETIEAEKIHIRHNHPKVKKLHCELCDFETNTKKLFQDHQASKCLKTFEKEEVNEHMKTIHW